MYEIIKREYDYYNKQIGNEEIVKTVCSKEEANLMIEIYFRGDSFTNYEIRKIT